MPKRRVISSETTDYEKHRMIRIQENMSRMESLGLTNIAYSLMTQKKKEKKHKKHKDDEYMPSVVEEDTSSSEQEEEYMPKGKKKNVTPNKKVQVQKHKRNSDFDDEDEAFLQVSSRVKMTEDQLVVHFFQLDEVGKGSINVKDLELVAATHDFTWTYKELSDMINCFDSNGDGKLSLDDFRKIVGRCNMIQSSECASG